MVKWKKMNKKMTGLLLGVMMLFTASTTAFAYVDESAEASKVETTQTDQSTDKEEKKDEAASTNEVLPEDGTDQGTAFTTPGNGEVKDDITDDSTKEFLTVTTKNNNTFYIVIDRSATSQKKRRSVIKRLHQKQIAIARRSGKPIPKYLDQEMERKRG